MDHHNLPRSVAELISQLAAEGVPASDYQKHIDRFMSFKAREQGVPYLGTFELTPLCNLDCKMCYVHLRGDQMEGRLLLTVDEWKDLMTRAAGAGMMKAKLTGGECLTYPGFEELFLHLHGLGINTAVLTNGILLDEARIRFFKEHPANGIQVTLYGSSDDAYEKVTGKRAFGLVYNNIRAAIEADLPISLAITPNRFMEDDAIKLIDTAQSLGVPYNVNADLFAPREDTGRAGLNINASLDTCILMYKRQREYLGEEEIPVNPEDLPMPGKPAGRDGKVTVRDMAERDSLSVLGDSVAGVDPAEPAAEGELRRGILCAAGRGMFEIDWRGRMYGCSSLRTIYADPLEIGFDRAWRSINDQAVDYLIPAECGDCAYSDVCITCPAAHEQNGSSAHCNRAYCDRVKRMVAEGILEIGR